MLSRKTWETAGFITIAAALHVSAAAILVGGPEEIILPPGPATGSVTVSAGGGEIGEMIEKWESQPEVSAAPEPAQPEPPQQEVDLPQPPPQAQPQAPEVNISRPNLPEPPELEQTELEEFEPPELDLPPPLALTSSVRPEERPARPKPEPQREVQRQAAPQPQRQQQAAPQRQAAPSGGQGSGGGGGGGRGAPSGGGGGLSSSQKANLMGRWAAQIQSCVASAVQRAGTSARRGGRVQITTTIAPSGAMLGARLTASSGDARADRDAARAVGRVGRCPAAPAGITENRTVVVPITIQRR